MFEDRVISTEFSEEADVEVEQTLRPKTFKEYIGQEKVKENMKIFIASALKRGDTLDHVLLYGPPGLGKTTLALLIAHELGVNIKITSGPAIEKPGDLAAILTGLEANDLLFIDEIHRLKKSIEEVLYPALEDFNLDIMIGKGPSAKSIRLTLPHFTLVGATTKAGALSGPLRDRFGIVHRLSMYSVNELSEIIQRSASILNIPITTDAALELGARSRGTPRIANRFLKRARDFAEMKDLKEINFDIAMETLEKLEIDEYGLDDIDRKLLETMIVKFNGRPVGLDALAASTGEDKDTIEDVYEPYLMQIGFINRTAKGRIATKLAYQHMGVKFNE